MARKVWLGNNVARTLTVGEATVEVGGTINVPNGTRAFLERRGHRFAEPKSDEAQEAREATGADPAGVPPVPAGAGASGAGRPAAETPKRSGK